MIIRMIHCFFSSLLKLNNFSGHGASPDSMYIWKNIQILLPHHQHRTCTQMCPPFQPPRDVPVLGTPPRHHLYFVVAFPFALVSVTFLSLLFRLFCSFRSFQIVCAFCWPCSTSKRRVSSSVTKELRRAACHVATVFRCLGVGTMYT